MEHEELVLGFKTWKRSVDPIEKDGFREGFEKGRDSTFQKGFNIGFKSGFDYAYQEAFQHGTLKATGSDQCKEEMDNLNHRCFICTESEDKLMNMELNEILERQKKMSSS